MLWAFELDNARNLNSKVSSGADFTNSSQAGKKFRWGLLIEPRGSVSFVIESPIYKTKKQWNGQIKQMESTFARKELELVDKNNESYREINKEFRHFN